MPKHIKDGVAASFPVTQSDAREAVDAAWTYMEALRPAWREYASAARRSVVYMFVLMAVFMLASQSILKEVTIAGLAIENISSILVFVPPLVGFFFLEGVLNTLQFDRISEAHAAAFAVWNSEAESRDLDTLIAPNFPVYWSINNRGRSEEYDSFDKLYDSMAIWALLAVVGIVLSFLCYAAYVLIRSRDIADPWAIASASAGLIALSAALYVFWKSVEDVQAAPAE